MGLLINKSSSKDISKSLLLKKESEDKNKPTRYYSNKQEKAVAKAVEGK